MNEQTNALPPDGEDEVAPGAVREELQGWIPSLATAEEVKDALEKAFDYRGDVMLTLKDGRRIEGFIFDRRSGGATLDNCIVRLIQKSSEEKIPVRYSEIARLEFSGRDTAAGKSFDAWVRRYQERKASGETNISLEPEILD